MTIILQHLYSFKTSLLKWLEKPDHNFANNVFFNRWLKFRHREFKNPPSVETVEI
jgi:hypothetical protein